MPLAVSFGDIDLQSVVLWLICWFLTIGLHEGAHAWVAYWLGDDTAYILGKRSINPMRHIDLNDRKSVIFSLVLPCVTALVSGWPIGIAWVPVNPSKFRHPTRDMALTSAAGPGGNVIGAALGSLVLLLAIWLVFKSGGSISLNPFTVESAGTSTGHALLAGFGLRMIILNVVLGAINLLPVPGIDGGSVLYHFLNHRGRMMFDQLRQYGILILIILLNFVLIGPVHKLFVFAADTIPRWIVGLLGGSQT